MLSHYFLIEKHYSLGMSDFIASLHSANVQCFDVSNLLCNCVFVSFRYLSFSMVQLRTNNFKTLLLFPQSLSNE